MEKYVVELRKTVEFYAYVEVEAESETLAQDKAYHMWEQDCDNTRIEWDEIEENCRVHDCERGAMPKASLDEETKP
jgi:hypothetical protein